MANTLVEASQRAADELVGEWVIIDPETRHALKQALLWLDKLNGLAKKSRKSA